MSNQPKEDRTLLERGPELRPDSPDDQFHDVWQAVDAGEWVHGDDARNAMLWKIRKLRASVTLLNRARETERAALRNIANTASDIHIRREAERALTGETAP